MSEGSGTWASGLGIPEDAAARFGAIARAFDLSAADLVGIMVARVVSTDADLHRAALRGLSYWGRFGIRVKSSHAAFRAA